MKVNISAKGEIHKSLREYVEEKTKKLDKYYERLQKVEVFMKAEGERYKVQVVLNIDGKTSLVVEQDETDLRTAFDVVMDKVERQLTKLKEKSRSHRIRARKEEVIERKERGYSEEDEEESYEDVIDKLTEF